ncbi:MAG: hypothetical protein PHH11_01470 [Methylomonas sp.]|nr:hypothetical protein [Methylomonas sp.]
MNIKQAEALFQAGALDVPVIKQHESGEGRTVTLHGKHKLNPMRETAQSHVRGFKRLDAVVGALFKIGFEKIHVVR